MKIKEFTTRGRELYAVCHGPHGFLQGPRRIPLNLALFDPEMDHEDLQGKLRCTVCGTKDPRKILLIKQTDRQMRQGRSR